MNTGARWARLSAVVVRLEPDHELRLLHRELTVSFLLDGQEHDADRILGELEAEAERIGLLPTLRAVS